MMNALLGASSFASPDLSLLNDAVIGVGLLATAFVGVYAAAAAVPIAKRVFALAKGAFRAG